MVGQTGQTGMGSVTLERQHSSQVLRNGAQEDINSRQKMLLQLRQHGEQDRRLTIIVL